MKISVSLGINRSALNLINEATVNQFHAPATASVLIQSPRSVILMNETENNEMDVKDNQNHSNLNYTTGYQHHKNMKKQLVGPLFPALSCRSQ